MSVTRHPNGNIDLKLSLSWKEIEAQLKIQTDKAIAETQVAGFRKGKAPRDLVEPQLDKSQLLSQSLSELLPKIYSDLVDKNKLKPILYPQIHIDKGKWGEDFEFTATTCEAPAVTLAKDYQKQVQKLKIKDPKNPLPDILEYLRENSQVSIPELLSQEEANHRLAQLAENLSQLGMDMNRYLTSKKTTAQDLKAQTLQSAKSDLTIEFILNSIQTSEKLSNRQAALDYLKGLPKT